MQTGSALAGQALVGTSLFTLGCSNNHYGQMQAPDTNDLLLPPGFTSRVVARSGQPVGGTAFTWHANPDGGAVFPVVDGWIYVSNSEVFGAGGVSAIRFNQAGDIVSAYEICTGTSMNCAGGATPWGTWLTCEERPAGHVYECQPLGGVPAIDRPAMGAFQHEAVAVDESRRHLYLTEDQEDGRLYRFTPSVWGDLSSGLLEVAEILSTRNVIWHPILDPQGIAIATRYQVMASTAFDGGEGIVYAADHVYFTTKGDDRVWDLDVATDSIRVIYQRFGPVFGPLGGVDNITTMPNGDLLIAEDGGNMELVMMTPGQRPSVLLRVEGQDSSELTGPAFDPSGTRLYFSSQRGTGVDGITYEVSGPFEIG